MWSRVEGDVLATLITVEGGMKDGWWKTEGVMMASLFPSCVLELPFPDCSREGIPSYKNHQYY